MTKKEFRRELIEILKKVAEALLLFIRWKYGKGT